MDRTERILLIRPGAIGDFIVTLPVIQLLRRKYSPCWLGVVAKNSVRSLVRDVVDEFVDIDGRLLVPFFLEKVDTDSEKYRYLAGVDLVVSYLGATGRVSENLRALTKVRVINADALPPKNYAHHITEFLLEPLAEVLDVSSPPLPTITVGEEETLAAERLLSSYVIHASAPLIAVHPGSGGQRKVSPARNFCKAVNWIQRRFPDARVLVIEGEADEEHVSAFERCLNTTWVKVKKDDLLEVAAILSRASLFIGNDSGIAHLAAAVGVPTIVVFRASNPAVWAPRGKKVWVATDDSLQRVVESTVNKGL